VTLLYGLTAAPASQPRNAILGQVISLTISLAVSYIDSMEIWMRQSLATSLAVTCMVKLGITHPPAGASALIFSSGLLDWTHMLMMIVGTVIAIVTATLINNISNKRQYPMYWGVGFLEEFAQKRQEDDCKKEA
jgi:CBS-domain-containing membrane protein